MFETRKYIFTFALTAALFATAFFASSFFSEKRVANVKEIQDNIAIDILSSETQFDLLKEVSCSNVNDSMLSPQLSEIGDKLSRTESDRGANDPDVVYLKKYYTLLEVKDFLLSKQFVAKCGAEKKPVSIIYFYSNAGDCPDCEREGYVLTRLKEKYPDLRVYSFDYNLDLSVVDSMKRIYKITSSLPALVIEDKTHIGFKSVEDLEKLLPDTLKSVETSVATSTATTTRKAK